MRKTLKTTTDSKKKLSKTKPIHVWYFWEGPKSITVEFCIQNWMTVLGRSKYTFEIHEINNGNVGDWINTKNIPCTRQNDRNLSALKSDFIRLALLEKYGGLYMDASVVMTASPDWLIKEVERGWTFQAFFNPDNMLYGETLPVMESSVLFASKPNHPLVKMWLHSMLDLKCNNKGRLAWLDKNIKDKGVRMQANLEYEYHLVYHALQMVFEKIKPFSKFKGVKLYNTVTYGFFTWNNSQELFTTAFQPKKAKEYPSHFLKLIKSDRDHTDSLLTHGDINKNSFLGILLLQNGSVHKSTRYVRPQKYKPFTMKCTRSTIPTQPGDLFKTYLDCIPCKGKACTVKKKKNLKSKSKSSS